MGDVRGRGTEHQGLGLEQPDGRPGGGQEEAESGSRAGRSRRAAPEFLSAHARPGTSDGFSGGN